MVEWCKWDIIEYLGRNLKDSGAESNADYGGPAKEVSEGKSNWARDHFCDILTNNVAAF